jgi:hypothetical protein
MEFWMEIELTIDNDDNSITIDQINGRTKWDPVIGHQQRIVGPNQWIINIDDEDVLRISNTNALSFWMEIELCMYEGILDKVNITGRTTWDVGINDIVASDKQWISELSRLNDNEY